MFQVITGGSGSGKSAYAENRVLSAGEGQRIYIATMIPYGEDGKQRVERHRLLRREKHFETVECYMGLENLTLPENGIVLLECMSNLVANEIFEPAGAGEGTAKAILRGIDAVRRQVRHLFAVTNEVFSDGIRYDRETERYLACLGEVNREMASRADMVTEIVYGLEVTQKPVPLKKGEA